MEVSTDTLQWFLSEFGIIFHPYESHKKIKITLLGKKTYPLRKVLLKMIVLFPVGGICDCPLDRILRTCVFFWWWGITPTIPPKTSNFLPPKPPTFFTNPRCGMWCESFGTLEMTEFSVFSTFTIRIVTNLSSANVPFDKIPHLGFRFRLESACLTIFVATRPFFNRNTNHIY